MEAEIAACQIPPLASGKGLIEPFYLLLDMYSELTTKP